MKLVKQQLILVILFLLATASVNAQDSTKTSKAKNQQPMFFKINVHYPDLAKEKKIEGSVIISFDIDSNCSVVNKKFIQKLGYGCDEEAMKVMNQYEIQLKQLNKSGCVEEKGLSFPVNFKYRP